MAVADLIPAVPVDSGAVSEKRDRHMMELKMELNRMEYDGSGRLEYGDGSNKTPRCADTRKATH